jgi:hypothetical protein
LASFVTEIPGYGTTSAVLMCDRLDIKSSKDADKLKQAKDEVYLKGYYEGVMLVGECAGMKVNTDVALGWLVAVCNRAIECVLSNRYFVRTTEVELCM